MQKSLTEPTLFISLWQEISVLSWFSSKLVLPCFSSQKLFSWMQQ